VAGVEVLVPVGTDVEYVAALVVGFVRDADAAPRSGDGEEHPPAFAVDDHVHAVLLPLLAAPHPALLWSLVLLRTAAPRTC
jgi:hypothetical protein